MKLAFRDTTSSHNSRLATRNSQLASTTPCNLTPHFPKKWKECQFNNFAALAPLTPSPKSPTKDLAALAVLASLVPIMAVCRTPPRGRRRSRMAPSIPWARPRGMRLAEPTGDQERILINMSACLVRRRRPKPLRPAVCLASAPTPRSVRMLATRRGRLPPPAFVPSLRTCSQEGYCT
jgi:hypothetical protein